MTAIISDDPSLTPRAGPERGQTADAIRREMVSLRARVRILAEQRAAAEADRFTQELRVMTGDAAREMNASCENRAVLARVHHRLARQVSSDLRLMREDDEASVDAQWRALLLARLEVLDLATVPASNAGSNAPMELTLGAARALRAFERHRDVVRSRFRALKGRLQTELADLSLEMAGETAARLCLRYGRQGQEWLWWRLSTLSLPGHLELLATRSVLSGLEKNRRT